MSRFVCTGTIRKRVNFVIEAANLDEAQNKALRGDWIDLDEDGTAIEDWKLDPETISEESK